MTPKDRRWAWVGGVAIATLCALAAFFAWGRSRDGQVVREVDAEVARVLMALPADDPITRRHGRFVRLEGERVTRSYIGLRLWGSKAPPITLYRTAVFDKTWAMTTIHVYPGPALSVAPWAMFPDEGQASHYQSTVRDGQVWFTAGTDEHYATLIGIVNHPQCPHN